MDRALTLQYRLHSKALYDALVNTWGDDPAQWKLPESIQTAIGQLLALYLANEHANHSAEMSALPTGRMVVPRVHKRGRTSV